MRRFLIDSSSIAFVVVLLTGVISFAPTASETPSAGPEALENSEHAAACHFCRLPIYGTAGEPSMLGLERS